jgi:hypothetical protein
MSEKLNEYLKKKSNLLNAAKLVELGLKNRKLTIDGVAWEQFKDGKEKLSASVFLIGECASVFDKWARQKKISEDERDKRIQR